MGVKHAGGVSQAKFSLRTPCPSSSLVLDKMLDSLVDNSDLSTLFLEIGYNSCTRSGGDSRKCLTKADTVYLQGGGRRGENDPLWKFLRILQSMTLPFSSEAPERRLTLLKNVSVCTRIFRHIRCSMWRAAQGITRLSSPAGAIGPGDSILTGRHANMYAKKLLMNRLRLTFFVRIWQIFRCPNRVSLR